MVRRASIEDDRFSIFNMLSRALPYGLLFFYIFIQSLFIRWYGPAQERL